MHRNYAILMSLCIIHLVMFPFSSKVVIIKVVYLLKIVMIYENISSPIFIFAFARIGKKFITNLMIIEFLVTIRVHN